jgi:hypothetical protein
MSSFAPVDIKKLLEGGKALMEASALQVRAMLIMTAVDDDLGHEQKRLLATLLRETAQMLVEETERFEKRVEAYHANR